VLPGVREKVPGPKYTSFVKTNVLVVKITAPDAYKFAPLIVKVPVPEVPVPTKLRLLRGEFEGIEKVTPELTATLVLKVTSEEKVMVEVDRVVKGEADVNVAEFKKLTELMLLRAKELEMVVFPEKFMLNPPVELKLTTEEVKVKRGVNVTLPVSCALLPAKVTEVVAF
jgi:hypothetical protein